MESPPFIPRVKICGIAREADAAEAVGLGADALGFLVHLEYETPDQLTVHRAASLISILPPFVSAVLVTHSREFDQVVRLCSEVRPQVLQLHGFFPVRDIPRLRSVLPAVRILKAVHVMGEAAVDTALEAAAFADALVLDTRSGCRLGGTGLTHDWSISRRIREKVKVPVILAGGLNPSNVEAAIRRVRPFGVDVNSGVSQAPGVKSADKILDFVQRARRPLLPETAPLTTTEGFA